MGPVVTTMSVRSLAVWIALAALALIGCSAAPGTHTAATSPPSQTDAPAVTDPPLATDPPPATDPAPGATPTSDGAPTAEPGPTDAPDGGPVESLAGTWVGTIETNGSTQEIRFVLRDLRSRGGEISGTALWESGKVDNGLRGAFEGDTLTLDDSLVNGINVYEGNVNGDVFTGAWTTVPRLEGQSPGTFEVTREE